MDEGEYTGRLYRSEDHAKAEKEFVVGTNEIIEDRMEELKKEPEEAVRVEDGVFCSCEEEELNKKGLPDSKAHENHKKLKDWQDNLSSRKVDNERRKLTTTILRKQREKDEQTEKVQIDKEEAHRLFLGQDHKGKTWPERRKTSILCEGVGAPDEENVDEGVEIL